MKPAGSLVPSLRRMTPPGGVSVFASMPDCGEGGRVEHRAVIGAVDQHDRVVGEVGVEVVAGQLAALGEVRAVIAVADDPLALLDPELLDMLLQHRDEVGDLGDGADGRARTRWPT